MRIEVGLPYYNTFLYIRRTIPVAFKHSSLPNGFNKYKKHRDHSRCLCVHVFDHRPYDNCFLKDIIPLRYTEQVI